MMNYVKPPFPVPLHHCDGGDRELSNKVKFRMKAEVEKGVCKM